MSTPKKAALTQLHQRLAVTSGDRRLPDPWGAGTFWTLLPASDPEFDEWKKRQELENPLFRPALEAVTKETLRRMSPGKDSNLPPGAPENSKPTPAETLIAAAEAEAGEAEDAEAEAFDELLSSALTEAADSFQIDEATAIAMARNVAVETLARRLRDVEGMKTAEGEPIEPTLETKIEWLTDTSYIELEDEAGNPIPYGGQGFGAALCEWLEGQVAEMEVESLTRAQARKAARKNSAGSGSGAGAGQTSKE